MAKKYKVWICIEEIDEDVDHYEDVEQLDCGEMEFNEAKALADALHDIALKS